MTPVQIVKEWRTCECGHKFQAQQGSPHRRCLACSNATAANSPVALFCYLRAAYDLATGARFGWQNPTTADHIIATLGDALGPAGAERDVRVAALVADLNARDLLADPFAGIKATSSPGEMARPWGRP